MSRLAINRLREGKPDAAAVDRFLGRHEVPIVEGDRCTFLWRGEADAVHLVQRIVGLPDRIPLRRLWGTDLWYVVLELPEGSRVNYQLEVRHGEHVECTNDPLNPKVSYSPVGTSSVCFAHGYHTPDWTFPDPDARPGELTELVVRSRALRRDKPGHALPARAVPPRRDLPAAGRARRQRLPAVRRGEDGAGQPDPPARRGRGRRRVRGPARPAGRVRQLGRRTPGSSRGSSCPAWRPSCRWSPGRSGRCLLGSSFGAVAALSTAYRAPDVYGSLVLMSGSFVFTDIAGADHGGGPVFDPVVRFVNRYRARPRRSGRPAVRQLRGLRAAHHAQPLDGAHVRVGGHGGALPADPRRPQLGELARQPARRPVVGVSPGRRSCSTSSWPVHGSRRVWTASV